MRRLFAQAFTVPLLDGDVGERELRYDEVRQLNLTPDGRPFIELGGLGGTTTITEVRAEQDDFDHPNDEDVACGLATSTFVRREADDFAARVVCFATETRQLPGEQDDFARSESRLGTETAIRAEADDFARSDAGGTARMSAHIELGAPEPRAVWAGTKTSVQPEADDFAGQPEDALAPEAAA